jgi:formate dehydrogenase maturation protein FdhE
LRCGRCGAGWASTCLWCPYCGTDDHAALDALVVEHSTPPCAIDACLHCLSYVKAFTTLRGSAPSQVMLDDLATAELDFCAAQRGYRRPGGLGAPLRATVAH